MSNVFRILLLLNLILHGFAGFSSEYLNTEDSLKYSKYSNTKLLSLARKAADNDSYEEAKTFYQILIQRDSINPLYNYECGINIFLNLFEQPLSLPYFENSIKYSTKDTIKKAFYYLGQAYQLNNRYDEAINAYTHYRRFIKNNKAEIADLSKKVDQCIQGKNFIAAFNDIINIDNVGNNINSNEAEYVPVVKGDESIMYFTARRKSNVGGEKEVESNRYFEDMFISKGEKGIFHVGERFTLGDTLIKKIKNTGAHESVVSLSYDEKYLITYKNNSLWMSESVNESWSKPIRFSKNINIGQYQNHGSFSAKNDTLYFSSNAQGGYGGMDIYMSKKQADGKWGKAINLGPAINTEEDEDSPSIAFDNTTLYFSSKGHNSMGGYDVFKSEYAYNQWLEPLNMGMPVNSAGDDIYFKYDKFNRQAYFSSSRQRGFGDYDIYRLIDYNTPRFDDCQLMNTLKSFPIKLDAKKSLDVKEANKEYHWEFSDGENAEGEQITHDFKNPGKHKVKLYVLDPIAHTLLEEKDTVVDILNINTMHFSSADTISVDSALTFDGAPQKIENATILKYHWSFGDSTQGSDSAVANHLYKNPGSYEVKLSMVARDDSTNNLFQKCVTKTVNILNKEAYMDYYLKAVAKENKKKGFNSEMLGLTHLDFLAPDTTTIVLENLFDAAPVFIPKSKILAYKWDFGDTLIRINSKQIAHAYDSIGVYKVNMNVIYQVDSTKGIYERDITKNVVVVNPAEFEKINNERIEKQNKPFLDFLAPDTTTLSYENVFDSQPLFIPNSTILKHQWTFGDSIQKSAAITTHSFDRLGLMPVKLDVTYQNNLSKEIVETSVTKNIAIVSPTEFEKITQARNERIEKLFEVTAVDKSKLDFSSPDTTTLRIKNVFDTQPLVIPNATILQCNWTFDDTTEIKPARAVTHTFDTIGQFPVKLNIVYQDKKSSGIYETNVSKNIVVVDSVSFEKISATRTNKAKKEYPIAKPNNTETVHIDTSGAPNIYLENIYFNFDKYTIRPDAKAALLRNIVKLGGDTLLAIKVSANTDSRGSRNYNFTLSAKRAISAINFMAENKIARDRIIAVISLGETNLVNKCGDNVRCTEKEHQLNRRDEFHIIGRINRKPAK